MESHIANISDLEEQSSDSLKDYVEYHSQLMILKAYFQQRKNTWRQERSWVCIATKDALYLGIHFFITTINIITNSLGQ